MKSDQIKLPLIKLILQQIKSSLKLLLLIIIYLILTLLTILHETAFPRSFLRVYCYE